MLLFSSPPLQIVSLLGQFFNKKFQPEHSPTISLPFSFIIWMHHIIDMSLLSFFFKCVLCRCINNAPASITTFSQSSVAGQPWTDEDCMWPVCVRDSIHGADILPWMSNKPASFSCQKSRKKRNKESIEWGHSVWQPLLYALPCSLSYLVSMPGFAVNILLLLWM